MDEKRTEAYNVVIPEAIPVEIVSNGVDWFAIILPLASTLFGGLIALCTTAFFERRTKARTDGLLAMGVVYSVKDQLDGLVNFAQSIDEARRNSIDAREPPDRFWQSFIEEPGPEEVSPPLSAEHLALMHKSASPELVEKLIMLHRFYRGAVRHRHMLVELRNQAIAMANSKAKTKISPDGSFAERSFDPNKEPELYEILRKLEAFSADLLKTLPSRVVHAYQTLDDMNECMRSNYKRWGLEKPPGIHPEVYRVFLW
ncbi:hypothetical protein [Oceanicaulis alexandrii]|uniref:hypothetical protein n=1 Tax=Oceanicaulis alexandrii TaxID=153233 RepID=UPI003B5077BA|tara:strand:- start:561 stop:1331 length:771 start_codon:yes stop_codon:yes gene_type:complete